MELKEVCKCNPWSCNRKILRSRFSVTSRQFKRTNNLINDMHSLLQSGMLADVTLHCGSEIFRVHKNILSARSPVFATMFLNPKKESQQDYVDIQGIGPIILRSLLLYIYSCKTEPLTFSLACDLLSAADMYQIPDLKSVCVDFLKYDMCEENVLQIIKIGDLFDERLKTEAAKFICDKYESIETKIEWKILQQEKPQLVIEVMALKINRLKCDEHCHSDTEMEPLPEAKRKHLYK